MDRPRRVGITFNPKLAEGPRIASELADAIRKRGVDAWPCMVEDPVATREEAATTDLMICLGGDGTVLRCARIAIGLPLVILGVNMGRLGFLTELEGAAVFDRLDEILSGAGRIERRTMLRASVPRTGDTFHAMNDVAVGRATLSRAIQLAVNVDGVRVADYRCDGVVVATATGSTAYALSVGGPILYPESRDLVVVPVAPHLAARHALVLPETDAVHITLERDQRAVLSVDGESDLDLSEGDSVYVSASEHCADFLRLNDHTDFYQRMAARLGWHRPGGNARPLPD